MNTELNKAIEANKATIVILKKSIAQGYDVDYYKAALQRSEESLAKLEKTQSEISAAPTIAEMIARRKAGL